MNSPFFFLCGPQGVGPTNPGPEQMEGTPAPGPPRAVTIPPVCRGPTRHSLPVWEPKLLKALKTPTAAKALKAVAILYLIVVGPAMLFALFLACWWFLRQPTDERWFLGGLLAVLILTIVNGLQYRRLKIRAWDPRTWPDLVHRACNDKGVRDRLLVGVASSLVIGLWVAQGAGIEDWPFDRVATLVVASGSLPAVYILRPLVDERPPPSRKSGW